MEIAIRLLSGKCLVSHSHGFGGGCARTSTWIIVGTVSEPIRCQLLLDVPMFRWQWQALAARAKRERLVGFEPNSRY